ncbi:Gfo/Idh/MocA family protein [Oceaniglobus indicus]|uniref:Gfo/Idh/MocA family protein n=1 Tax=Oceaniglobus indicus TaxID=2047749 RepID=UPI001F4E2AFE|nr:Gfo/Idh/MocA family oxidoreductase [Oceaniglobus indicus]
MIRSVAILGAGIGAAHMDSFGELPDRFRVATICDIDAERARRVARRREGVAHTTDIDAVLADPAIDIVDICLPPALHFEVAERALNAGKAVICEKPLVDSLAEADALAAVVERTGGMLFPVFQYRYGIGAAQVRALIDAGLAGRCFAGSLETHWDRNAEYYAVPWRGTWSGEKGGTLLGHAIHIHDLLSALLGPVAQVFADTATRVNAIEVEDCVALAIRMASGAPITSSVTLGAAGNMSRLRLCFEGFTVESDRAPYTPAASPWTFTARAPLAQDRIDAVLTRVPPARIGFAGLFEAVADALDGTPGREVTLADGRRSLEFVTAAYASARANAPVALPLGSDHPMYRGWLPTA